MKDIARSKVWWVILIAPSGTIYIQRVTQTIRDWRALSHYAGDTKTLTEAKARVKHILMEGLRREKKSVKENLAMINRIGRNSL